MGNHENRFEKLDPFSQNAHIFMKVAEMKKKLQKIFLVFGIMAFEPVVETYLYYEENSCDWQSKCYQTVLNNLNKRHVF